MLRWGGYQHNIAVHIDTVEKYQVFMSGRWVGLHRHVKQHTLSIGHLLWFLTRYVSV